MVGWDSIAVEQSRSVAQILASNGKGSIAVMPLIRWQIILAKLIETSTELLQSMFAASGGLARSKDVVASPPPPTGTLPKSRATFPAAVMSHHEEGLHVFITRLETGLDLLLLVLQLSSHTRSPSYPPISPICPRPANIKSPIHSH